MEHWQLQQKQSLPLECKIAMTENKITDWYNHFNGKVYISFSGGKDSTVLLHIARSLYPNIPAVFVDTGLEYPEIVDFVDTVPGVIYLKPKMNFKDVITKYGYPVISKKISNVVQGANPGTNRLKQLQGNLINKKTGELSAFNCKKYKYLLDAPFKISDKCCHYLKKQPGDNFQKETGLKPMYGLMASESRFRQIDYLKTGCNAFDIKKPQSQPIAFWNEDDIWEYLRNKNVPYSKIYDMGYERTGCMFCMFGVHLEKGENRFQRMKKTHPKQYNYCINKLGCGKVLDHIGVKYDDYIEPPVQEKLF